ncbi:Alpha-galactosidase A [Manis javanica]|nr:Alpha-galactosidase A [Manis javanica]
MQTELISDAWKDEGYEYLCWVISSEVSRNFHGNRLKQLKLEHFKIKFIRERPSNIVKTVNKKQLEGKMWRKKTRVSCHVIFQIDFSEYLCVSTKA